MSIFERMPAVTSPRAHVASLPPPASAPRWREGRNCLPPLPASLALRLQDDDLPIDPRVWDRSQVGKWVSQRGGHPDRFPMNGKALCLMTAKMFAARVPHQATAVALHHEFRRRLAKALALQDWLEETMTTK